MNRFLRRVSAITLALVLALGVFAAAAETDWAGIFDWYDGFTEANRAALIEQVPEDGAYDDVLGVGAYLFLYDHLPGNYITKSEARGLGWPGGSLEPYAPGKTIGGDRFGNYEGLLPEGARYTECDIDTMFSSSRGAKRLVFDGDGRIYYTEDHYDSFTLLYGGGNADAPD